MTGRGHPAMEQESITDFSSDFQRRRRENQALRENRPRMADESPPPFAITRAPRIESPCRIARLRTVPVWIPGRAPMTARTSKCPRALPTIAIIHSAHGRCSR